MQAIGEPGRFNLGGKLFEPNTHRTASVTLMACYGLLAVKILVLVSINPTRVRVGKYILVGFNHYETRSAQLARWIHDI